MEGITIGMDISEAGVKVLNFFFFSVIILSCDSGA